MQRLPDYYAVLGIAPSADQETIRVAYRNQMKRHHPDLADPADPDDRPRREATAKRINEAYRILRDPIRRHGYDRMRQVQVAEATYRTSPHSQAPAPGVDRRNTHHAQPHQAPPPYHTRMVNLLFYQFTMRYGSFVAAGLALLLSAIAVSKPFVAAIQWNDIPVLISFGGVLNAGALFLAVTFHSMAAFAERRVRRLALAAGLGMVTAAAFVALASLLRPLLPTPLPERASWLLGFAMIALPQMALLITLRADNWSTYQELPFKPQFRIRVPRQTLILGGSILAFMVIELAILHVLDLAGVSESLLNLSIGLSCIVFTISMVFLAHKRII